jgi:BMFP domain-containing protein YqiC
MTRLYSFNHRENTKVYDTWNEFSDRMGGLINTMTKETETHTNDIYTSWDELSGKFQNTINGFLDEYNNSYEYMYTQWIDSTRKIGEHFAHTMKEFGADYENLYKSYFERTANFQRNIWISPFNGVSALHDEVDFLKQKIADLEKKLAKKGSK